jgi:hypothetical protein
MASSSEKDININEGRKINIGSKALVRTMIQGGLAAVLAACGATSEVKKDIPQISLNEIIANPSLYSEVPLFKTKGYPEQIDKMIYKVPIIQEEPGGLWRYDWITTETDTYELHLLPDPQSPSIEFTTSGGNYFPVVPVEPGLPELKITDLYEVTGTVVQVKAVENNNEVEKYILEPNLVEKVVTPALPTNK